MEYHFAGIRWKIKRNGNTERVWRYSDSLCDWVLSEKTPGELRSEVASSSLAERDGRVSGLPTAATGDRRRGYGW